MSLNEAREEYRREPTESTANMYYRFAWKDYLDNRISEEALKDVMREVDGED